MIKEGILECQCGRQKNSRVKVWINPVDLSSLLEYSKSHWHGWGWVASKKEDSSYGPCFLDDSLSQFGWDTLCSLLWFYSTGYRRKSPALYDLVIVPGLSLTSCEQVNSLSLVYKIGINLLYLVFEKNSIVLYLKVLCKLKCAALIHSFSEHRPLTWSRV